MFSFPSPKKVPLAHFLPGRPAAAFVIVLCLMNTGGAASADASKRVGIDVSRFQERIHWPGVDRDRIDFAFVQASRGSGEDCTVRPRRCGPDGWFAFNRRGARAVGIPVGAYHRAFVNGDTLFQAKEDARAEARVFLQQVRRLRRGDLLPVLDVEPPYDGLTPRRLRGWVRVWLDRVHRALGVRPMIYTSELGWEPTGDTKMFARAGHRLWVAHWEVPAPLVPAGYWAGRGWSVWQFSSSGRVRGIRGPVDLNRLGTPLADLTVGDRTPLRRRRLGVRSAS